MEVWKHEGGVCRCDNEDVEDGSSTDSDRGCTIGDEDDAGNGDRDGRIGGNGSQVGEIF
jgi:hypothetical protein